MSDLTKEAADEIERLRTENINVSTHCAVLIEQNRELLAALKHILPHGNSMVRKIARAAVEKAEKRD